MTLPDPERSPPCRVWGKAPRWLAHVYRSTVPPLQRTIEYDNAPVLCCEVRRTRTAPPSPDRGVAAVRALAVRHPIPRHPAERPAAQ